MNSDRSFKVSDVKCVQIVVFGRCCKINGEPGIEGHARTLVGHGNLKGTELR